MSLTLRSETFTAAPNGGSNTRTTVGVGESVIFTASQPAHWSINRDVRRGTTREYIEQFTRPGEYVVRAEAGSERAEITISVVAPTLRYEKVSEPSVPTGVTAWLTRNGRPIPAGLASSVGVAMELRLVLEPLTVSFTSLEVRELDCPAEATTGVYTQPGMAPRHEATRGWTNVGSNNVLGFNDLAAACWVPGRLTWPIPASSYRWRIPAEYRLAGSGTPVRFSALTTQEVQFTPDPTATTSPRGTFTIRKGGRSAAARV